MTRRLRALKRWMASQGIDSSDGLEIRDDDAGIRVVSTRDLGEGEAVARIPKSACLTARTSGAREAIEEAGLGGSLGLAAAVMYERALWEESAWAGYLQALPRREAVPLAWEAGEIDEFLVGTELHKTVKEDKALIYEDWKECILPLLSSAPLKLEPRSFGYDQYVDAKSLVTSRSFEIDDYHGFGMVPLADLFNHKTGAENVHFTNVSSDSGSDNDQNAEDQNGHYDDYSDNLSTDDLPSEINGSPTFFSGETCGNGNNMEDASSSEVDSPVLEMIIVKGVKSGDEVFNTYGYMGNAALLHRYGFTELDNPYDIVNIDLKLVIDWSSSQFSSRYTRARVSMWRRFDLSGCVSQNSEYFEISSEGEPQLELLILLYVIFLPDGVYHKLNQMVTPSGDISKAISTILSVKHNTSISLEDLDMVKDCLLIDKVCRGLVSLAEIRERYYGKTSLDDDEKKLMNCCKSNKKLYHSLVLRVSERRILKKLKTYASRTIKVKKRTFVKRR
ncbi:hypothetical protein Syun_002992 [Stephania yunnanensis]|uniref:N-lysine methyltransferase n=1 Tax=Stephania yunnanensis TaxID=152371 RepID=A0AAP0L2X8_9MAGN